MSNTPFKLSVTWSRQQCISPYKVCQSSCLKNDYKCGSLYAWVPGGSPRMNTISLWLSGCCSFGGIPSPGDQPEGILFHDDAIQRSGLETWHLPVIYLKVYHKTENRSQFSKLIHYFLKLIAYLIALDP